MVIGGMVPEEKEAISPGDELVAFDTAWKYKYVTVSDTSTGLTSGNPYAIKFTLPASG